MRAGLRAVPLGLVAARAGLAPVVVGLAVAGAPGPWTAAVVVAATLTDVFDGVLARRLNVATERLRRLDSAVDTVFYLAVLAALALRHGDVLRAHAVGLALLVGLEAVRHGFDVWKFGRTASYHMWSAKLWGLSLALGLVALFGWGAGGWPVVLAVWLGVATNVEALAASAVLSRWHHDVPSLVHAVRLERTREPGAP